MWHKWLNKIVSLYLKTRVSRLENIKRNPHFHQKTILLKHLDVHRKTEIGQAFDFRKIKSPEEFRRRVPIHSYEDIHPSIERMMKGERDVLAKGRVNWYAKSSGTTSARSKFIPVTDDYFYGNIIKSSWDTMAVVYNNRPSAEIFSKKSLVMGGSLESYSGRAGTMIGDVSAIMIERMPTIGRPFYTPDFETALLSDWEEKIDKIISQCVKDDVVLFGGVPTWNLVLFEKILEVTGKNQISEIWPNIRTYLHGGVGFEPYKDQFDKLLGIEDFEYYEVYNASEGFFAVQDIKGADDMLLLLDNGIYYEFIPSSEWNKNQPDTITLEEVEPGKNYAIVITNAGGLWRYTPGDTITFSSTNPYRIKVTGRTKHFINVFGEEVMVGNTDKALALTCSEIPAVVKEYTVGPVHLKRNKKGGHLWVIEFEREPEDRAAFERKLDINLRKINSDYDAKRHKDLALSSLKIKVVPKGTFLKWMRSKGKMGGQNKVPRLHNSRQYLEQLLEYVQ
jgi:hypothetical protein